MKNDRKWLLLSTWRVATGFPTKKAAQDALKQWKIDMEALGWEKSWGNATTGYTMKAPEADFVAAMASARAGEAPEGLCSCGIRPGGAILHPDTEWGPPKTPKITLSRDSIRLREG